MFMTIAKQISNFVCVCVSIAKENEIYVCQDGKYKFQEVEETKEVFSSQRDLCDKMRYENICRKAESI